MAASRRMPIPILPQVNVNRSTKKHNLPPSAAVRLTVTHKIRTRCGLGINVFVIVTGQSQNQDPYSGNGSPLTVHTLTAHVHFTERDIQYIRTSMKLPCC